VAQIWTERFRPGHHAVPFEYRGSADKHWRASGLIPKHVLLVKVVSFTFQFVTVRQLRDCIAYFASKIHPSSRLSIGAADHWEVQRWFECLPMYLLEESKRKKVVKALNQALAFAEKELEQ
jgi:hypothetical protein